MNPKLLLRELYGKGTYVTSLPDGQNIPWTPLSIGDFLYYDRLFGSGQYPDTYIENEIFRKCVRNPVLTKQIDRLHAGIVSTVVYNIMQFSSPSNVQELQYTLQVSRFNADTIMHDLSNLVIQAYPSYKPEELYAMDIETFMLRVATAERKLMKAGLLQQPITFESADGQTQDSALKSQPRKAQPPPVNVAQQYKKQSSVKQTIITNDDITEAQTAYTGHERADKMVIEDKMVKETMGVYDDYLKQIREGKKLQIKTPEERKTDALVRTEANRKTCIELAKKRKTAEQNEMDRLAKQRKVTRSVKRKR